jgi:D-arabinose 1-dehydrogenase-like Zn-dependent alcohol dehydrogenase
MKAAVVPSVNGKWEVKEWQTPKAGPNQVVIKIHASGLCYTDVHLTHGLFALEFPRVLGHEPVGEIVEVGPGVTSRKVGDRVGVGWVQKGCGRCQWCLRGKKELCQNNISTGISTQGSPSATNRRPPFSAPDTQYGAGCVWLIPNRTSASRWSALVGWAIWRCSIPKRPDSRPSL